MALVPQPRTLVEQLADALVEAGVPFVSIFVAADGTRSVTYPDTATAGQRTAGDAVVRAYDPATALLAERVRRRNRNLDDAKFRVLARAVHIRCGRPDFATMSGATWRNILEAAWEAEHE